MDFSIYLISNWFTEISEFDINDFWSENVIFVYLYKTKVVNYFQNIFRQMKFYKKLISNLVLHPDMFYKEIINVFLCDSGYVFRDISTVWFFWHIRDYESCHSPFGEFIG